MLWCCSPRDPRTCETHLSAEQSQAEEDPRLPSPDAHARREKDPVSAPEQGPGRAVVLTDVLCRTTTDAMPPGASARSRSLETLRRSPEIRRVMGQGRRLSGGRMVLYVLPEGSTTRVGFACPRAIGGAVVRNRARRLMKEAWRACASRVREGYEVMIVARP